MNSNTQMTDIHTIEHNYYDITELYDFAESLADTVDRNIVNKPEEQLALVEPLIEQVSDSAEILEEEYLALAEGKRSYLGASKKKIEGALRKMYSAMDNYNQTLGRAAGEAIEDIRNAADPIVRKMKRHMENIIAHFMAFVDVSLGMIMHTQDAEGLKQRNSQIAAMLHAASQSQSPAQ